MTDYLVSKGADPTLKDVRGYNILHLSAIREDIEFLSKAMQYKVSPFVKSRLLKKTPYQLLKAAEHDALVMMSKYVSDMRRSKNPMSASAMQVEHEAK